MTERIADCMDPVETDIPPDVAAELQRVATSNGRIEVGYLMAIYRYGRRHGRALAASAPDAGLIEAVREWQAARKPMPLPAPGEKLAETYQAAVRRMAAADEALAGYDLNGPAGGALGGQIVPPESTGVSLRDELAEIIRWRFKSADGKPLDGAETLSYAQEIADAIVPMIEEAVGER